MQTSSYPGIVKAPRFTPRRYIRHYVFPGVLALVILILAAVTWSLTGGSRWPFVWMLAAWICIGVDDLTDRDSLSIGMFYKVMGWLGREQLRPDLSTAREVYNIHRESPFHKNDTAHLLASVFLLMLILGFAVVVSTERLMPGLSDVNRVLIVWFLLLFALIPYGGTFVSPLVYSLRYGEVVNWVLILIATGTAAFSLFRILGMSFDWLLVTLAVATIYLAIFASQRMWGTERAVTNVLHKFSADLLAHPRSAMDTRDKYWEVVNLLHEKLRHQRAFILLPTPERETLKIEYAAGRGLRTIMDGAGEKQIFAYVANKEVELDMLVPIARSISGRAFLERDHVIWNDVGKCGYHVKGGLWDTCSEIAVPIVHEGKVYGVINVQSPKRNLFEPEDVNTLDIVGRMLGAAMAVDERNEIYKETERLWHELAHATRDDVPSEARALDLVADCVSEVLGNPVFIYFPLTPAGWPLEAPLLAGLDAKLLKREFRDEPLLELIGGWDHRELKGPGSADGMAMARRPWVVDGLGLKSVYFVPIGRRQEKLGALFIGYNREHQIDGLFTFTALSLAQALGELMAELRYRSVYSEGFGRPELGLHTLIGNYRGKESTFRARAEFQLILDDHRLDCPVLSVLDQADAAFRDLEQIKAATPPSFWNSTLAHELDKYNKGLASGQAGTPRPWVDHDIDPRIHEDSPWIQLALYRVIVEAANNAFEHGRSVKATVWVRRQERSIEVEITNRGVPPPPYLKGPNEHKPNGIYHLLELCRKTYGANCVGPIPENGLTRVAASIPAPPIISTQRP